MKITRLLATTLDFKATTPTQSPLGAIAVAINLIVRIETDAGLTGWGETSPFGPITGDTQSTNLAMVPAFGRLLLGQDPCAVDSLISTFKRITTGEPSLRSALDMALHEIAAQAANMPLYQYLGGTQRTLVTDITIGIQNTVEQTIEQAQQALGNGFTELKLNVGRPGCEDIAHVEAVRALAGPNIALRIDSNQGWTTPQALHILKALEPCQIDYSEQPVPHWDSAGMARIVRDAETPVCADESLFPPPDAANLARLDAADIFNIKLGKADPTPLIAAMQKY